MRPIKIFGLALIVSVGACADTTVADIPQANRSLVGCYELHVAQWRPDPNEMTTQRWGPPPSIESTILVRLLPDQPWPNPEFFALDVTGHPPFRRLEKVWRVEEGRLILLIGAPFGPYSVTLPSEEPMQGAIRFYTDNASALEWVADAELRPAPCG